MPARISSHMVADSIRDFGARIADDAGTLDIPALHTEAKALAGQLSNESLRAMMDNLVVSPLDTAAWQQLTGSPLAGVLLQTAGGARQVASRVERVGI